MKTKVLFKSLILFYFLHLGNLLAQEPYLDWVHGLGENSYDYGQSITVDNLGNVYSIGFFEGTVDFDPGIDTFNLTSLGLRDIYIQKCDENGNLIWVKQMGGDFNDQGQSIYFDNSGYIYSTGSFVGEVDFDPSLDTLYLNSNGGSDIFIQKLDTDGNLVWVKSLGGTSNDGGISITVDTFGNIITTGSFKDTVDFNPGIDTNYFQANGSNDIFIQKLDNDGDLIWTKTIGGISDDISRYVTTDTNGNIYTTGHFKDTVDFNPGISNDIFHSNGNIDAFIHKIDSNGNYIWTKHFGGNSNDLGICIQLDQSGNIYTIGRFQETVDFNPNSGILNLISNGSDDIFIQKLDNNGNLIWVNQFGGTNQDFGNSIDIDELGNIYATGYFRETVDFDPSSNTSNLYSTGGSPDTFIQKLDNNGNLIWIKKIGGSYQNQGKSIISKYNNVYITGIFSGITDFDPNNSVAALSSAGLYDAYVLKLYQCTPTTLDFDVSNLPNLITQCSLDTLIPPTVSNGCVTFEGTTTTTLPLVNQGNTVITWNYDDGNGNTLSQDQTVVINDETNPTPDASSLPSISALCEVSATDAPTPTGTDNCTEVTVNSNISFPITDQNINEIVWTYEDGHGNTTTQTQTITWSTLDVTTALNGFTITANNTNATYQWLNCSSNSPIAGQSNATFTATANGEYAVEITENGCIDTSACVTIAGIGLNELDGLTLAVYPNPSKQVFNIQFEKPVEYAQLKVTNLLGKTVYTKMIEHGIETQIDLKDQVSGLYLLHILTNNGQKTVELIKE